MILLDTSVLVDIERGHSPTIRKLKEMRGRLTAKPSIPFIVYSEYLYGGLRRRRDTQKVMDELAEYHVVQSSLRSSAQVARIRYELQKKGMPIGASDLLIAAIARAHNATLITKDDHFTRIQGLDVVLV